MHVEMICTYSIYHCLCLTMCVHVSIGRGELEPVGVGFVFIDSRPLCVQACWLPLHILLDCYSAFMQAC